MAASGMRLVYGGGSIGLMGILARSVLANGGKVTGIIPQFLKDREVMLKEVPDLIVTADMHERKRIMFQRADAFVALPGGIGTLEEVVEVMTWAQLDQHAKPVLIVNINGFWDSLVALFRRMSRGRIPAQGVPRRPHRPAGAFVDSGGCRSRHSACCGPRSLAETAARGDGAGSPAARGCHGGSVQAGCDAGAHQLVDDRIVQRLERGVDDVLRDADREPRVAGRVAAIRSARASPPRCRR